jgi:biopolymer transport protein ExbD
MAAKRRFLDVWIIDSNTIYREVPFEVVTDWVQQGRLLADDKLRPSGTAEWFRLGDNPSFAAYLPRAEPHAANDQAEALERVEVGFDYKPYHSDDDEDVDMIPLIDVSLVLLVFFIMTAAAAVGGNITLPQAKFHLMGGNADMLWIGIQAMEADPTAPPSYSLGAGESPAAPENTGLTEKQVLDRLDEALAERQGRPAEAQIKADENLPSGFVRRVQVALEQRGITKITKKYLAVNEKQP